MNESLPVILALDLDVVESDRFALTLEPVSLSAVMSECQAIIAPQAQQRGISMVFPDSDTSCFIKADRTRVKQVMINLLSNAIKYNHAGGIVLVDSVAISPGRVRISVKDTGAGVSPEKLAQLFQPFNRLDQEAGSKDGTGSGLVVSKRLVELMEGTIGVESIVGEGSEFWIELGSEPNPHDESTTKVCAPVVGELVPGSPRISGFSRWCSSDSELPSVRPTRFTHAAQFS